MLKTVGLSCEASRTPKLSVLKHLFYMKEILATGGAFAAKIEDGSTVLWGALGLGLVWGLSGFLLGCAGL